MIRASTTSMLERAVTHPRLGTLFLVLLIYTNTVDGQATGRTGTGCIKESDHVRARDLGIAPGVLAPGPLNAITDVQGVLVGHSTVVSGNTIHTGATAILPHGGNLYQSKVPAGVAVFNGYGKFAGLSQIA